MSNPLVATRSALIVLGLAVVLSLSLSPVSAQGEPLAVDAEHVIQIIRGGQDSHTMVIENIFVSNTGDQEYSGELWLDLHPEARDLRHYWHESTGERMAGPAGTPSSDPMENSTEGSHVRHVMQLEDRGVTIGPGETLILVVDYYIPNEEDSFTRGFTFDTQTLSVQMGDVPGLRPVSEEHPMESVRDPQQGTWTWRLSPDARGPFEQGDEFSFTWQETEEALEPLAVDIEADGDDPVRLNAMARGGIEPYEISWDLDGDGECDDAQGETAELSMDEPGMRQVRACVTDSVGSQATQTHSARFERVEGTFDGPSPWLLLVIGLLGGGFLVFALTQGGFLAAGRRTTPAGPSLGAESSELLELRQRVMVASLKELEIAKKKGEVPEAQYTSLKSELKKDTVNVMRELERRKTEKETV